MLFRCLELGLLCLLMSGCGEVAKHIPDASSDGNRPPDARLPDATMAVTHQGSTQKTMAVPFGGPPYCNYTITLVNLEIDLDILPSGQVTSGTTKDSNVEGTDANCPNGVMPSTAVSYTLQSAAPNGNATRLTFAGAAANAPSVDLVVDLTRSGTAYSTVLMFHRNDQAPPLDWKVTVSLPLAPL